MNRPSTIQTVSVLFVCMGNICRSPTAQGALEKHRDEADLPFQLLVDSAGTHAYHAGEPPDRRAVAAAERVGIDLSTQRARAIRSEDFTLFDHIIAMDKDNLFNLSRACPRREQHRIRLLMDYGTGDVPKYVPDPFYGGAQGFTRVVDLTLNATAGLLHTLTENSISTVT
ncbi:MAG: low molecular weight protein-tyrosine-phosphatase [Pseudomonadota bacterium]